MLAWHYTTGENFKMIVADGALRPWADEFVEDERPILWFSMEQDWEPSATKGVIDSETGKKRLCTWEEMLTLGDGVARLGTGCDKLIPFEQLCTRARIPTKLAEALVTTGRKMGADPANWLGTLDPMPIEGMAIDVLQVDAWVSVKKIGWSHDR